MLFHQSYVTCKFRFHFCNYGGHKKAQKVKTAAAFMFTINYKRRNKMNRRYFMKGAILTGAAAALGFGLSQTILPIMGEQEEETDPTFKNEFGKVLLAYYSLTGHTTNIAARIRKFTGGDIFEIATAKAYDVNNIEAIAREEVRTKFTPALKNHLANTDYDLIFIGSPIWWFSMASPVLTFVRETRFTNKVIVPYCTHGGNYGQYFDRIAEECSTARIIKGRDFQNSKFTNNTQINEAVKEWLLEIKQNIPKS